MFKNIGDAIDRTSPTNLERVIIVGTIATTQKRLPDDYAMADHPDCSRIIQKGQRLRERLQRFAIELRNRGTQLYFRYRYSIGSISSMMP